MFTSQIDHIESSPHKRVGKTVGVVVVLGENEPHDPRRLAL
jgi:hypothetical protein